MCSGFYGLFCRENQISRKDDPVCVEGVLPRVKGYLLGGWVAGSLLPLPGLCCLGFSKSRIGVSCKFSDSPRGGKSIIEI